MTRLTQAVRSFARQDEGQDLLEYALLVALIALVAVGAVTAAGVQVNAIFGVYPGFPTIFRGLSGFFVGDLRKRPCGSSWKTRSVFQGAVGALCASTAPSASTGPVRVRQNGSRGGNGELDRRRPRTAVDP